jgi:hypothetical protein
MFYPVACTADEAKALQQLLKLDAQEVLTGADATGEKVKGLHGPPILHASHGFFLIGQQAAAAALRSVGSAPKHRPSRWARTALRSGLAWPGPTCGAPATTTTAFSPLPKPRSSICAAPSWWCSRPVRPVLARWNRARGYGLRRALVLAGAQAQLVSLWKVADQTARRGAPAGGSKSLDAGAVLYIRHDRRRQRGRVRYRARAERRAVFSTLGGSREGARRQHSTIATERRADG